jgi:hypothetical protein
MTAPNVFQRVLGAVETAGIPYMLTGSFASAYHGMPRATQDIDIVIAPTKQQLQQLVRLFPAPTYYVDEGAALEALSIESQFNVLDLTTGWKVDLIVRKSRPFSRVEFDRRITAEVEGMHVPIASAEDIVLAKLEWAKMGESERQIDDVAGILRVRAGDLDVQYIERWVRELGLEREWEAAGRRSRL